MPMDRSRYPKDWNKISASIRKRAGDCCEQCGVPNGAQILRLVSDPAQYYLLRDDGIHYLNDKEPVRLSEMDDLNEDKPYTKIVLTVHHIGLDKPDGTIGDPRDKMDCRPENLLALCQRCHLLADKALHVAARRKTKQKHASAAEQAAGQLKLW